MVTIFAMLLIVFASVTRDILPFWIVVLALFGCTVSFAVSLESLPRLMMSEVFPLNARGASVSLASVRNCDFNFVVVFLFPAMLSTIGLGGAFTLFAVIYLGRVLLTAMRVSETRGVSLEAIEVHLRIGAPLNTLEPTAAALAIGGTRVQTR